MEKNSAIEIANIHIENLVAENKNPDFSYFVGEPKMTEFGFYFEYKYELKNPNIRLGGAPGFIVNNAGDIEVVSWERLNSLKFKE